MLSESPDAAADCVTGPPGTSRGFALTWRRPYPALPLRARSAGLDYRAVPDLLEQEPHSAPRRSCPQTLQFICVNETVRASAVVSLVPDALVGEAANALLGSSPIAAPEGRDLSARLGDAAGTVGVALCPHGAADALRTAPVPEDDLRNLCIGGPAVAVAGRSS